MSLNNCLNDKGLILTFNEAQTFLITTILLEKLNGIAEMPIHLTLTVDVEKYLYLGPSCFTIIPIRCSFFKQNG